MKKSIYAFAIMSSLFLVSCGGDSDESSSAEGTEKTAEGAEKEAGPSIVGTWKLTDADMGMEIPAEQQEMYDAMMKQLKEKDYL